MKLGIKTTEFWITMLTIVASAAASLERILDPKWAVVAATISTIIYTISRSFVKANGEEVK